MQGVWEALMSYPPSLISLLLGLAVPLVLLVGLIATGVKKEGGRGFAIGTTAGPAIMTLLAIAILVQGASSGISDGAEAWQTADPAMRAMRVSSALSSSMWATAFAMTLLMLLVPTVAFGSAILWGIRNHRSGADPMSPLVAAVGISAPCLLLGGAVMQKVSGLIAVFGGIAYAAPEDRARLARTGVEELHSLVASGAGITVVFLCGLGLVAAGAALAAKKQTRLPGWALGIAAAFALVGLSSAALVHVRASVLDEIEAVASSWELQEEPDGAHLDEECSGIGG